MVVGAEERWAGVCEAGLREGGWGKAEMFGIEDDDNTDLPGLPAHSHRVYLTSDIATAVPFSDGGER